MIQRGKWARVGVPLFREAEAVAEVRQGADVVARNKDLAQRIAAAAGDGAPIHNMPHGPLQLPHYHPVVGGECCPTHVLY
jgi:hypothetical protein